MGWASAQELWDREWFSAVKKGKVANNSLLDDEQREDQQSGN